MDTATLDHPAAGKRTPSSPTPPPQRRKTLKIALIVAGVLLIAAGAMAPLAAKWAINYLLKARFSSIIALEHLGFNPFTGQLDLSVKHNSQLELDRHHMEWDWLPLLRHTIRVNDIHLKDLTVEITRFADGSLQIGDIRLEAGEKTAPAALASDSAVYPIYVEVRNVVLDNIQVKYTDPPLQATLAFDQLHLQATGLPGRAYVRYGLFKDQSQRLDFSGDVRLTGLKLQLPVNPNVVPSSQSTTLQKLQGLTAQMTGLAKFSGLHVELQPASKSGRYKPVFRVDQVDLTDNASFRLQGKGFRAPVDVTFQPVDIQLKDLDSAKPGDETTLSFETSAGGTSKVSYRVKGKPLETPFSVAGLGKIAHFNIPPLSPVAERFIGYRVDSGKLNLVSNISVKRGRMDTQWDLLLNRFEVQKLDNAERDPMDADLGVPLETGLMLIKDKNDDVHLVIPLQADLNDPDNAASSVMSKALSAGIAAGIRASISKIFAPVSKGGAVQLAPLTFAPGKAELTAEAIQYLKEVGDLLVERPGVKLKLKGFGPANEVKLTAQRVDNVKTHLTAAYAIQPERLPVTAPEAITEPAVPRVELAF